MTPEDRKVLSLLLEKVKKISALKDYQRYIYFINKCIEEAEKRNATQFLERFRDMRNGARLSYRAFDARRQAGARLQTTAGVHIRGILV